MSHGAPVDVAGNLHRVNQRIAAAAREAGRDPGDITLIAVSKAQPFERVPLAAAAGQLDFGENYVQELLAKQAELALGDRVRWHFIGHLQTNKVRQLVGAVHSVHSVDRVKLAREIGRRSAASGWTTEVLIQVNVGEESTKSGLAPAEVEDELGRILEIHGIRVRGLMTVPPFLDPEEVRPHFARLRELRDRLEVAHGVRLPQLSMGMSGDFEVAIQEGATHVRVGSAIFGARAARR